MGLRHGNAGQGALLTMNPNEPAFGNRHHEHSVRCRRIPTAFRQVVLTMTSGILLFQITGCLSGLVPATLSLIETIFLARTIGQL